MEGGEDANEEPAYVTTTAESPTDVLHIQVDMVDDDRGGGGGGGGVWCIHGDGGGGQRDDDDVSMVATRLRHLDDIGSREDFHRQCCEVSCCTAKQVIEIMQHSGSYKVSLVQIASEIFLLQNLLNTTHYNCTEELLDSWLSVQEEKDQGTSAILENVNKMVALVESVEHLVIFLRSLLKRFGTRFLGLCSDLALRALKQQRHLAGGGGVGSAGSVGGGEGSSNEIGDCGREKLSQTLDVVGQMYFNSHRKIYLACLLSALYVEPTSKRYSALEIGFTHPSPSDAHVAPAAGGGAGGGGGVDSVPVSSDVLVNLLQTINVFRPIELDVDVGWTKLKPILADLFFHAGYSTNQPINSNAFTGHAATMGPQSVSCGFSSGVVSDNSSWLRTTQVDVRQTTADSWCGLVNSFDCSTSSAFVEGKKPWSAGDASSALCMSSSSSSLWSSELYCGAAKADVVTSSMERGDGDGMMMMMQVNGKRLDDDVVVMMTEDVEVPDSTSTDIINVINVVSSKKTEEIPSDGVGGGGLRLEYLGSNGSINSNGFNGGSSRGGRVEPWKGGTRAWPALESDDESSNPLNIASAEEEDVSSITEEVTTLFESSSSAFSKKRSASAEMMSSLSSSSHHHLVAEPCRKRRAVSISRTKSKQQTTTRDEKDTEPERDADATHSHLTDDNVNSSYNKRSLRPKDRLDRSRVVTRKTFCFRYKYSSSSSSSSSSNFSRLFPEETGKRSVSESEAASKSKISFPNGIKLRNCFIRLNRLSDDAEQNQPAENNAAENNAAENNAREVVELCRSAPLSPNVVQSNCSATLTRNDEDNAVYASQEEHGSALAMFGDARNCAALLVNETMRAEEMGQEDDDDEGAMTIKEEDDDEDVAPVAAVDEKVVQCVCDGCGEIVPDCSWLTAHIVTCTGRPESGATDAMMMMMDDDELTNNYHQTDDAPLWDDTMGGNGAGAMGSDNVTPTVEMNGGGGGGVRGRMLSMDTTTTNDLVVPFTSQTASDVEATNLMQQLMQNSDNQSSFIYDPSMTSENASGVKVIQMSDGTSFSMSTQPSSSVGDASDDPCGKEVLYNGVYMYEFSEYQCDLCLLTFASHSATADHIRSSDHSGSTISRNSFCCCLKCSIRYREKHIMWHHVLYLCGNTIDETTDESRLYRCLLCCKAFLSAAFLRRHVCLQHGRQALIAGGGGGDSRPLVQSSSSDGIVRQLQSGVQSDEAPQVVSRLTDYGIDGQLLGSWNCYQVNESGTGVPVSMATQDVGNAVGGVFSVAGQQQQETTTEVNVKTKVGEGNGASNGGGGGGGGESGANSQALLDLACSIVLGGCSPSSSNFTTDNTTSAPAATSHPPPAAAAAPAAAATSASPAAAPSGGSGSGGATPDQSNSATGATSGNAAAASSARRTAKGIMYKNVFMQCIVNYLCSTCKKDLSTKASKKEHKSSPCFDADSKRFTYLRQYSYLCPYCSEKFPSQKFCRQHQLSVCLQLMGVKTDELNHKQLLCPFCDRKYFNIITLKGHMTLIHKVNKLESSQILGTSGLLEELISFAPDAAGLSEKAKKAKQQTTAEEDRKHAEANKLKTPPPLPLPSPPPTKEETTSVVAVKDISPTEVKSDGDLKLEMDLKNNESEANKPKPNNGEGEGGGGGEVGSPQKQPTLNVDLENGMSHDSGLESNVTPVTTEESDASAKDIDRCELQIVEVADPDGLVFDGDASNDTSTDDPSELDEVSCETDNTLPTTTMTNDVKESQINDDDDEANNDTIDDEGGGEGGGEKCLKRKKSNKKTRRKVVTKTRKKLH